MSSNLTALANTFQELYPSVEQYLLANGSATPSLPDTGGPGGPRDPGAPPALGADRWHLRAWAGEVAEALRRGRWGAAWGRAQEGAHALRARLASLNTERVKAGVRALQDAGLGLMARWGGAGGGWDLAPLHA